MKTVPIRRGLVEGWVGMFVEFVEEVGFTRSGIINKEILLKYKKKKLEEGFRLIYFENDEFILSSYYAGSYGKFRKLPNFKHKKTGFELRWVGSIEKGLYSEGSMGKDEFADMLYRCKVSVYE